ncbi:MAG: hypothetical protein OXC80_08455 [Gammaproteobacteria bacterium]|nr:hypothetical protein [Gammaproteobacteria bacterium]
MTETKRRAWSERTAWIGAILAGAVILTLLLDDCVSPWRMVTGDRVTYMYNQCTGLLYFVDVRGKFLLGEKEF